ncbi:DNA-binding protein [Falsiroseomonas bella]|uniref:DNA-binding protein n=1 Tax=Falsiroseomonas bella TaxID=2184016 RepID=A0A317FDE7_9PROT|nr:Zn-ribbon domain-containing OB-fold protein [Falsiroseomonas bella]PWS37114.1 DNA-binding protein [Falsiroseomonas bella]
MTFDERPIPAPIPDPITEPFWHAAREGRLTIGRCNDTGRHFFPPRGVSPFTLSPNVELVQASGRGVLYSWTVMRTKEPYIPAMVELAEGPRLFTNLVQVAPEDVRIGMALRVVFVPTADGPPVPMFAPA